MGSAPPSPSPQGLGAGQAARAPQLSSLAAVQSLASVLRPCYGPLGRQKLLVPARGASECTGSAAPILQALRLEHPAARLVRDVAQRQAEQSGDGAACVVLLGAALLRESEQLLAEGLARPHLLRGLERAATECGALLPELAVRALGPLEDPRWALAATVGPHPPGLATLVAAACGELREPEGDFHPERLTLCGVLGGRPEESRLLPGLVLAGRPCGKREAALNGARVAVFSCFFGPPGTHGQSRARLDNAAELDAYATAAERWAERQVGQLVAAGVTAAVFSGDVDERAVAQADRRGLLVVQVRAPDAALLSRTLGVPLLPSLLPVTRPAPCRRVYPQELGDSSFVVFELDAPTLTLLLRGPTDAGLRASERAARQGLAAFAQLCGDPRLLPGAGASEMALSARLGERGARAGPPDGPGLLAWARALRELPEALAENAGLEVPGVLAQLRGAVQAGHLLLGVGADGLIDVALEEVWEPLATKAQAFRAAAAVAQQLVAVDDIVVARQLPATPPPRSASLDRHKGKGRPRKGPRGR
ncbi:T-complex protein 1 subunit theta-like 2 [Erinaceus europaeus]|uniref:T-complex protein 1 subunit theta-like 2 n=1 Tax=Erinaceus europaeus TaxID=9365 RepID=A0A1S3AIM6_ERIEU|nr:T-complex protein 1 subunit theta-like 2 [Erinaceus europaeus]